MAKSNKPKPKKIGILTGGGDCPGLNAVIRAAVKTAFNYGWEVYGIKGAFDGLLDPENNVKKLEGQDVAGILNTGGTILGTCNRGNPFEQTKIVKGKKVVTDSGDIVVRNFKRLKLDGIVAIGGDGTLSIAQMFCDRGIPVIGVPKTIDNDLLGTVITFGFDTAVTTATDAIDKLHSTAESHKRVMVVEVMGRNSGWIALNSGVAGGADVILIPEIPFQIKAIARKIEHRYESGREFAIVVVAEGAKPKGSAQLMREYQDGAKRLSGIGEWVANEITKETKKETRFLVLGHLQRGGNPTTFDRLVSTRFGAAAMRLFKKGQFGKMVALDPPNIKGIPIKDAIKKQKKVPVKCDVVETAREIGISFGDK